MHGQDKKNLSSVLVVSQVMLILIKYQLHCYVTNSQT